MNKDKNNMPQGQAEPGKGGKKPGPPKPKNMKKTLRTLMSYLGNNNCKFICNDSRVIFLKTISK